jgi:hypothetical protein
MTVGAGNRRPVTVGQGGGGVGWARDGEGGVHVAKKRVAVVTEAVGVLSRGFWLAGRWKEAELTGNTGCYGQANRSIQGNCTDRT